MLLNSGSKQNLPLVAPRLNPVLTTSRGLGTSFQKEIRICWWWWTECVHVPSKHRESHWSVFNLPLLAGEVLLKCSLFSSSHSQLSLVISDPTITHGYPYPLMGIWGMWRRMSGSQNSWALCFFSLILWGCTVMWKSPKGTPRHCTYYMWVCVVCLAPECKLHHEYYFQKLKIIMNEWDDKVQYIFIFLFFVYCRRTLSFSNLQKQKKEVFLWLWWGIQIQRQLKLNCPGCLYKMPPN